MIGSRGIFIFLPFQLLLLLLKLYLKMYTTSNLSLIKLDKYYSNFMNYPSL